LKERIKSGEEHRRRKSRNFDENKDKNNIEKFRELAS
jgi:hypothetical protein